MESGVSAGTEDSMDPLDTATTNNMSTSRPGASSTRCNTIDDAKLDLALDCRQASKFLDLPAEVRNNIYFYAVTGIPVCPDESLDYPLSAFDEPPITRTCRQIRSEALAIFYGENSFRFDAAATEMGTLRTWIQHLGIRANLLCNVEYKLYSAKHESALAKWHVTPVTLTFHVSSEWPRAYTYTDESSDGREEDCWCTNIRALQLVVNHANTHNQVPDALYSLDLALSRRIRTRAQERDNPRIRRAPLSCRMCGSPYEHFVDNSVACDIEADNDGS